MKKRIKDFFTRIIKVNKRPDMILLPGQLAFFLVLATIPTITLITYGASILNLSTDFLKSFFVKAFSKDIADLLLSVSNASNAGIKLTLALLFSYYIASNGASSVIITSNQIYGLENGSWSKRRLKAIFMTFIFVLIIVFLLIIPIFGDQIVYVIQKVNMNPKVTSLIVTIFNYLKSPIMWIFLFLLIKLIYVMAPDRYIKSHNANYGAIFTTISWILTTEIYSYYINNIANYSALYGSLTGICVLMIWFYFISYFFVIGLSLNFQRENEELEKTASLINYDE
ncbi:MAG: YihY/virulence factor BrkB family protein [Bacilli bacterium]|nr:YihY/virulence factor BrkB family protein [Bacilli bacterium]